MYDIFYVSILGEKQASKSKGKSIIFYMKAQGKRIYF